MNRILINLDKRLKRNKNLGLDNYAKEKRGELLLNLLEFKIKNYNAEKNYSYLSAIFNILPTCFLDIPDKKRQDIIVKVNTIHYQIKEQIELQKQQGQEISQFLKDTIDNIEALTLALNYDYLTEYHGNKYSLIEFLVFKLKNPIMIEDAIKRFPYIVNLVDANSKSLLSRIIESYIEAIFDFTTAKGKSNDEVVYYDKILNLFLSSKELYIDYELEQQIIRNIEITIDNIDFKNPNINQEKLIFWLNSLKETLERKEKSDNFKLDSLLYKYDIPSDFSIVVNQETERIAKRLPDIIANSKRNPSREYIITIDGDSAYEIDDGISVKKCPNGNYILGVHIADPTILIKENSIIFEEVKRRTTSIYLSDRTIAMYPPTISKDLLSLKEKMYNMAMSFYLEIDPSTSEVVNLNIKEQKVFVNRNLTYDQVNDYLNQKMPNDYILATAIENLEIISEILNKKINIDDFYRKLYRRAGKKSTNALTKSQKLVELSMLITNYKIAEYMNSKGYPFIYRNHKVNEEQALEIERLRKMFLEEEDKEKYEKHFKVLTSTYPRAEHSIINEGHFGLGLTHYSHVTSPLRREEDNLNHIAIREFLICKPHDKRVYELEDLLKKEATYMNKRRKPIEDFSTNYELGKSKEKTKMLK